MPPSLPQHSDNGFLKNSEPYYTNEDVAILHDIVVHAEELLPSLPERERVPTNALFHAYYNIIPAIGIDADHDNRYARILFKIGGARSDGSLYDKFEAVLSRMGIEIQFEPEQNVEHHEASSKLHTAQVHEPPPALESSPEAVQEIRGRRRRNSESQTWDTRSRNQDDKGSRRRSCSSVSSPRSTFVADLLAPPGIMSQTISQDAIYSPIRQSHESEWEAGHGNRARLTQRAESRVATAQLRSVSKRGNMQVNRRSNSFTAHNPSIFYTLHSTPAVNSPSRSYLQNVDLGHERVKTNDQYDDPGDPSPIREEPAGAMTIAAERSRVKTLVRQAWSKWHQEALQLQEDNGNLELLANHRDRQILLRQALDSWHVFMADRRRIAETNDFFAHLEKRATRARDLYLLSKAFTHWEYGASHEAQRTTVARRHLLRLKYFTAWRDNTAVNALKARRQVVRKSFSLWQIRHAELTDNIETAATFYTKDLVQRLFWAWFWSFCERRAPAWRSGKLQGRHVMAWARLAKERLERNQSAVDCYQRNVVQKIYHAWLARKDKHATQRHQAKERETIVVYRKRFIEWSHRLALLRSMQSLRQEQEGRLKRYSLKLWTLRAIQENRAAVVDHSKIMREAWVTWNDALRSNALQSQIKNRVILQALYRWVLIERMVLARRLLERRTVGASLQRMIETHHEVKRRDIGVLDSTQGFASRKLIIKVFRCWRSSLMTQVRRHRLASDFNSPLVLANALTTWATRARRIQQLQSWARDGHFYFVGSRSVKSWMNATQKAKHEKRRIAYAQFRRGKKFNLATRIFSRWQQQAKSARYLDRQAVDLYYNKNIVQCVDFFDRWRGRNEEVAQLEFTYQQILLQKSFNEMKICLATYQQLEKEAVDILEENRMALCMKRWNRVALQSRARQHMASELGGKYLKKATRRIIGHWRQRRTQSQSLSYITGLEKRSLDPPDRGDPWSEFGDDQDIDEWMDRLDEVATSTPVAGYLSTPSKRMSRAGITTKSSSTTPKVLLSTPAETALRAQYSAGSISSFRRAIGKRSLLGKEEASAAVKGELTGTGTRQ